MRTTGEYRRVLHIRSVEVDPSALINKKHRHRKRYKGQCGTHFTAGNTQSVFLAETNRKRRLLRQSNKFQSIEILDERLLTMASHIALSGINGERSAIKKIQQLDEAVWKTGASAPNAGIIVTF